ncbi:thiol:disulfide interchange protein DsbC [Acinetobacter calcoaceticus]|uniref:Thiol:disulfide interchange protein n=1 Tax=Acinetobacter calcoaceticus TaxID=471 RepID=A0A4R1Y1X0_ACICA|nr:thiol:disulfide interchange protein DsbC [Acinetobacter calcoaceticus]
MQLTRSKVLLACYLASGLMLSACSKADDAKKDNTLIATAPATGEESNITERNAKQRLIKTLDKHFKTAGIDAKITDVQLTEMPNIYWVTLEGMGSVYVSSDGKYLIQGDVIRLGGKELSNISDQLQAAENKILLANLKTADLLVYPTKGKTKHVVYIFTDASCPYCHKLHAQIPDMNSKGIEVRYIAWPRGEQFMPAMESIWCSPDRQKAFDQAITDVELPAATCANPVKEQYQLGLKMGVNGTPAIYNSNGQYLGGYLTADEVIKRLEK